MKVPASPDDAISENLAPCCMSTRPSNFTFRCQMLAMATLKPQTNNRIWICSLLPFFTAVKIITLTQIVIS